MSTFTPCWTGERVEKVLRIQASDVAGSDFLASHTPMGGMEGHKRFPTQVGEEEIFEEVRRRDVQHALIVVQGEPGGGKSHLVRWLNMRLTPTAEQEGLEVIFIERENSTLRGVIEQVATHTQADSELNARLARGIGRLNEAGLKSKIQADWAREIDRNSIREDKLLPHERRVLLNASGVSWGDLLGCSLATGILEEKGGYFDRIAKQIGVAGNSAGPAGEPDLTVADLKRLVEFPSRHYEKRCSRAAASARDYLEAILDSSAPPDGLSPTDLVRVLNEVMSSVVREALQISRTDFETVFLQLRQRIYQRNPDRRLVLLIEDLFPFKHLDEALMNALIRERRGDESLACLTSVVGMTTGYWNDEIMSGRAHLAERITHRVVVPVGPAVHLDTEEGATGFVARYLNVIRHRSAQELDEWIRERAELPSPSACRTCSLPTETIEKCLSEFGAIGTGADRIGLFPFTRQAIGNLVTALRDEGTPSTSPRLLLSQGLYPLLKDGIEAAKRGRAFPDSKVMESTTFDFPLLTNQGLKEVLDNRFETEEDRETAYWVVRAWGRPTEFITPGRLGGVDAGIFARLGVPLPDEFGSQSKQDNATEPQPSGSAGFQASPQPADPAQSAPPEPSQDEDARAGPVTKPSVPTPRRPTETARPERAVGGRRRASEPAKPSRRGSGFDPRKWVGEASVGDGRPLATKALSDALQHVGDHFAQALRLLRLREPVVYLKGQQISPPASSIVLDATQLEADGLTAVDDQLHDKAPSPASLRQLRRFRRKYARVAFDVLKRRECSETRPGQLATAVAWALILDGVLRARVDCSSPPRQWLMWSLAGLEEDDQSGTHLEPFRGMAQALGVKKARPLRVDMRALWRRLSMIPRAIDEEQAMYAADDSLAAVRLLVAGTVPPLEMRVPLEANEVIDFHEAFKVVASRMPAAIADLSHMARGIRQRWTDGCAHDPRRWRDGLLALCDVARMDTGDDPLRSKAANLSQGFSGWSPPERAALDRWMQDLLVLASGKVSVEWWQSTRVFRDQGFVSLDQLHVEGDQLCEQVRHRVEHLQTLAPASTSFDMVRKAATALRDLINPETPW